MQDDMKMGGDEVAPEQWRRGYGPQGSWTGLHHVVDHFAALQPRAPALEDASGCWSYEELRRASLTLAALLSGRGLAAAAAPAPCWAARPPAPRPLAICMPRSREFFALCIGAWRLGVPVVAMSLDMEDKALEQSRNAQIMRELRPFALIAEAAQAQVLLAGGQGDATFVELSAVLGGELLTPGQQEEVAAWVSGSASPPSVVSPGSVMVYVYTGGTTKASKCVTVTHAMAMWESENYSTALCGSAGQGDKMLQYSTLYWGAAVFGQYSLGLAVGGCVCIGGALGSSGHHNAGDALQQIVADVEAFRITVLGIVPSQLRGAWSGGPTTAPRCVRVLISWADKCPVELSRAWQSTGLRMIDLLIASEYWLALYSDCAVWSDAGIEKHIYRKLPPLDARFMVGEPSNGEIGGGPSGTWREAALGEVGEMYLAGPTVSPGYVCPDGCVGFHHHGAAALIDGRLYLRTRDMLRLLPHGGLVYAGRADSMMKHGGAWVDADALADAALAVPGVVQAAVIAAPTGVDAFLVLRDPALAAMEAAAAATDAEEPPNDGSPSKKLCVRADAAAGPDSQPSALPPFRLLAAVRKALPGSRIHLRNELPLNPATGKVDRRALGALLNAQRDEVAQHLGDQLSIEQRMVRYYQVWGYVALGVVWGPQLLLSSWRGLSALLTSVPGSLSSGPVVGGGWAACLQGLGEGVVGCVARTTLLPYFWGACAYLETATNPPGTRPWAPPHDWLAGMLRHVGLSRQFSRWLPLVLAGCLPRWWLNRSSLVLLLYLSWVRERSVTLSAGLCSLVLTAFAGTLLPGVGGGAVAQVCGALAAVALTFSSVTTVHIRELVVYLASVPGLFYIYVPKILADDFGRPLLRRYRGSRWLQGLEPPKFQAPARVSSWGSSSVDWKQVELRTKDEKNPWNSVGVQVCLPQEAVENSSGPLASVLRSTASSSSLNGVTQVADPNKKLSPLEALVERVYGPRGTESLHGMDSMQAIQLTEAVRREFGKSLSVSAVLTCTDLEALEQAVASAADAATASAQAPRVTVDSPCYRRIWLCGMGRGGCSVDWMVGREDRSRHLDADALNRAVQRLVARHEALRARNWAEQPMFMPTYDASSLWQLSCSSGQRWTRSYLGSIVAASIFGAWPRSRIVRPTDPGAIPKLLTPRVNDIMEPIAKWNPSSDDELAFWVAGELYNQRPQEGEQLFCICLVPIFHDARGAAPDADAIGVARGMPPEDVRWYIYAVLDHGYCDGPAGMPLFADLCRLYAQEAGEADGGEPEPAEALPVLERRVQQSLKPLPEAEHPNDDIFHDGLISWGGRAGYQRFLQFDMPLMKALRHACRDVLGCSVDVAWLTALSAAFLRLFPALRRLDLYLVVTCRDRPAEEMMIGYFSSRKILPLEVGDPKQLPLMALCDMISTGRRQRSWRRPRPYEKAATCIEVNIVSQASDGLPFGFSEVRHPRHAPRGWDRSGNSCMTVRLDQAGRDSWDFRLQSHDAKWGGHWSSYYAQALGCAIVDMATRALAPVVPTPRPEAPAARAGATAGSVAGAAAGAAAA